MPPVPYPPGETTPRPIDPMDVDEVIKVSFDWQGWLDEISAAGVDESSWVVSVGGKLGDGSTPIVRGGKNVTPAAPVLASPVATAHVYVDIEGGEGVAGITLTISNHVRAGNLTSEKSATVEVAQL